MQPIEKENLMTETDGWIKWDGGGLEWGDTISPVPRDTWIRVKFRGAAIPEFGVLREYGHASQFAWWHDDVEDDIIAYKLEPKP